MHTRHGFTLLELSIVIVIIALLLGGVIAGRNMVDNAEARTIMLEVDLYTTSFKEFSNKYRAFPGDMNDATSSWGTDDSCPTTAANTTPKMATCNGDGNGTVGDWYNGTSSTHYESFRAWQHMSNAELVEGQFTGARGSGGAEHSQVGVNVPRSKTGKAGWTLMNMVSTTDNDFFFSSVPVSSHVLIYGGETTTSYSDGAILTPLMMKNVDGKIDDNMPYTGKIRAKRNSAGTCGASSAITSDYVLTETRQYCQLMYLMGL